MRRKHYSERKELFPALPGDLAPRYAQDLMAYPFFSLAETKRFVPKVLRIAAKHFRSSTAGEPVTTPANQKSLGFLPADPPARRVGRGWRWLLATSPAWFDKLHTVFTDAQAHFSQFQRRGVAA
ncbi:hypothetical protein XI06_06885 [Bradyrhizobium sp. CCBAU 11434]|nr:hypothetical protein [Bradyrhizobium sp. CCBAU 11434]